MELKAAVEQRLMIRSKALGCRRSRLHASEVGVGSRLKHCSRRGPTLIVIAEASHCVKSRRGVVGKLLQELPLTQEAAAGCVKVSGGAKRG